MHQMIQCGGKGSGSRLFGDRLMVRRPLFELLWNQIYPFFHRSTVTAEIQKTEVATHAHMVRSQALLLSHIMSSVFPCISGFEGHTQEFGVRITENAVAAIGNRREAADRGSERRSGLSFVHELIGRKIHRCFAVDPPVLWAGRRMVAGGEGTRPESIGDRDGAASCHQRFEQPVAQASCQSVMFVVPSLGEQ